MENQQVTLGINPSDYKILVVDDVLSNVMLLKALLKNEKYQIVTATDGQDALNKLDTEEPDLILLDVMMPGLSGFDVSKIMHSTPKYREIPIIFLTALNGHEDIVKGFQLGANDFVTKPFNKSELMIRISHQISLLEAKRIILRQTEELRSIIIGRDKLYSVIAHDLRGPLGSIKMILNLILCSIDGRVIGTEMFDMLKIANQTTEELFTLLDNLLKWTKSQLGKLKVAQQIFDITDIIKDSIEICKTTAGLKNITIIFNDDKENLALLDPEMIKTVARNLLSNAIKFSHNNSSIWVSINTTDDALISVSIKDEGCGIKEEAKAKLLHTESHFSTFGTNNEEGSGLGLLICADFVAKNGGNLTFESEEGVGSTFTFTTPKANATNQSVKE